MSDDIAEIIELRPGQDVEDDSRPLVTGARPVPFCQHHRCRLDTEARRVYCRECDREVPAFDRLLAHARAWERFIEDRRAQQLLQVRARDLHPPLGFAFLDGDEDARPDVEGGAA